MIDDIRLIAAVGRRGQLGLNGTIPWKEPADLKWFMTLTEGCVVILGNRTASVIGELKGRYIYRWYGDNPKKTIEKIEHLWPHLPIWIAGGAYTYKAFMPHVKRAIITRVDYDGPADVWMEPLWTINTES